MNTTFTQTHATNYCSTPPHKLLIFKDFSESLSYIYIKAKVISKIVALIQHNQKNKMRKKRQTFQLLYKTAPHFPRWPKGGDKRRSPPCRPHGAGGVPPPLSCASRPLCGLRCSPRRPPRGLATPRPPGGSPR